MKKKFIIAFMVSCLSMVNVAGALATISSPVGPKTQKAAAGEHDHSCCPEAHSRLVPPLFVKPAAMPCGDQHPCCAKQAPENPASLPATTKLVAPASDGVLVSIGDQVRDHTRVAGTPAYDRNPPRIDSARSAVLRI